VSWLTRFGGLCELYEVSGVGRVSASCEIETSTVWRTSVADIFISHSGKNSEVAAAIGEPIRRDRPIWSLFCDMNDIRAGQRWQKRLRAELTSCRVVQVLLSRNWLVLPWCFTEAVTATFRGKDVVGTEGEDVTGNDLARARGARQSK